MKFITNENMPEPAGAFSHAVLAGDLLLTSGLLGVDRVTGELVTGGVGPQLAQAIENLHLVLASEGLTLDDVVKLTVHLSNLAGDFAEFDEEYKKWFKPPYPVRTTVESGVHGALVEIDAMAFAGDTKD